jgi:dCMP deaminase
MTHVKISGEQLHNQLHSASIEHAENVALYKLQDDRREGKEINWTEYFLNIANQVKLKSKDKYTQIGVVLVGEENEIVSTGYNSFPRGINDYIPERQERPEKYFWFAHAELNSIVNAARIGVSTKNTTMYMTCGIPCCDCAQAIINAGVNMIICNSVSVVSGKQHLAKGEHWEETYKRSRQMFEEAGVDVVEYA